MKRTNRFLAFIICVCMVVSIMPPIQIVHAAETIQRYELDTDGIDVGATYLIVNTATSGTGNALRFYYSGSTRDLRNQTVTVKNEDGIKYIESGFTNADDCTFVFSDLKSGTIMHGNYYVDLSNSRYTTSKPSTNLNFTNVGDGAYRIYYSSFWRTYYLRYSNSDWSSSSTSSTVYLYKLTDHVVGSDVVYNGNGYTAGTLPENDSLITNGTEYTVKAPSADIKKDVGEDTYLFLSWNTSADGSGKEYRPGDKFVIEEDVVLYAQWYQQVKQSVTVTTYLDGTPADVYGENVSLFIKLENTEEYIPLKKRENGVYGAKVVDNGNYFVYILNEDGNYVDMHGHQISVYNFDGTTDCLSYTASFNTNGGLWDNGEDYNAEIYHSGEAVYAPDRIPTLEGNLFKGWEDKDGNLFAPGQLITSAIDSTVNLSAKWEDMVDVTVNVLIKHNATAGTDNNDLRRLVEFLLLREEGGVGLPVENVVLSEGYVVDTVANTTMYTVTFKDMPRGLYLASCSKSSYEYSITRDGTAEEDQIINIELTYAPDNFDLYFDVVVNCDDEGEKSLIPDKVNVKVSYWGYNANNELGWHIITQQDGNQAPVTVDIDENGKGTGFYPVWGYWSGFDHAYEYRIEIVSFVLPDGSIVRAGSDNKVDFTIDGSDLYSARVTIEADAVSGENGRLPVYPDGSNTELYGSYTDGSKQIGIPKATIEISSHKVTFDAGEGTVNGSQTIVLENQYLYPNLNNYVAIPNSSDKVFVCWVDQNGEVLDNLDAQFLNGDVTYYARYNDDARISGNIIVDSTYLQGEEVITIHGIDRLEQTLVVLQKKVGDVYNDVESVIVNITYDIDENGNVLAGVGEYFFDEVLNDGTEYRVSIVSHNYSTAYDNNGDGEYSADQYMVEINTRAEGEVDMHLAFKPESYQQGVKVDASQIQEELRPTHVLVRIVYRDLGDTHNFNVISQHTGKAQGILIPLDKTTAKGVGFEDVWNWHTNGTPYEYQAEVYLVYGNNVEGAYTEDGYEYTANCPYEVIYGPASNYYTQLNQNGDMLELKLVPKQYPIYLDLNLGEDAGSHIFGLEEFMIDNSSGSDEYAFMHTWSYAEAFNAYPYREGYVFTGWTNTNEDVYIKEDGMIHVGSTLSNSVTLTANWEKLEGTDYTILYLELNTNKVLRGAKAISGVAVSSVIYAVEYADSIDGYVYAGAYTGGEYHDKTDNPSIVISDNPNENVMIIYYLPDGSDGYTEQVESNLEINKYAVLEDDGTYTITLDTYTKDNPITTLIQQNTPLDIVLVLDQSGSLASNNYEYLNALQDAVNNFVETVADHGRHNEVDHRIALVGFAGNETDGHSSDPTKATGGKEADSWINTGVFDSNGEFHLYNIKGFVYTELSDVNSISANGIYYTRVVEDGKEKYLLLTHHDEYRHLLDEEGARIASLRGEDVYGYVYDEQDVGSFVLLTRNSSGLWLYGDKQLYSGDRFFTYHTDVWTHRDGINPREIHAYGVGSNYNTVDGHSGIYTRTETTSTNVDQSIYVDAMIPVSIGAMGSGGTNPGLIKATQSLGADGATRASYGMEMANNILAELEGEGDSERIRLVVMFTDGEPGYLGFESGDYYQEGVEEANKAISYAYDTKNVYNAHVYTIGLYESAGVNAASDVSYYMNALSSNYPYAKSMSDVGATVSYSTVSRSTVVEDNGRYYVKSGSSYYVIKYGYVYANYRYQWCWYADRGSSSPIYLTNSTTATVGSNGRINGYTIYLQSGGLVEPENTGYYATTESSEYLKEYFENVLKDITTKITTEIVLKNDTILRDILNQGLVFTDDTVITVYTQEGNFNADTQKIDWTVDSNGNPVLSELVSLEVGNDDDKKITDSESGVSVLVYNYDQENATDPNGDNYKPHTVDVTGYNFAEWYISESHTKGYKMVVTITRIEAKDDVEWGKSTSTNNEQSGLWLPIDENGNRQLLLAFEQPKTIFVERAYVLDYGKTFDLSSWYFDDEDGKDATPIHVDCDISNGMNYFDPSSPNTSNSQGSSYGNLKYGNVKIENGVVSYSPTTTNWGSYDQFYVFGNTWRKTVLAQDANENGNLWNKVTIIPANNIYYEDSFITTSDDVQNSIEGFTFTGDWAVVGQDSGNTEVPEYIESPQYGGVHGWTDSLGDDQTFTDGSAHATGLNGNIGASATFTFTGTGVDVYTFTNDKSGRVVAMLSRIVTNDDGTKTTTFVETLSMDNLAMSGEYYSIPTISFSNLPYGTYSVQLIATSAYSQETGMRYEYYIDGIRIYNPLGNSTNYMTGLVKDAYGFETNAVFTEVRDILLGAGDFNTDLPDGQNGQMGAVFIDWLKDGQGSEGDQTGIGVPTYNVGTFNTYGPKNEVYLSKGQAIVLKVDEENYYFVGLKSLTGAEVAVNLSGTDMSDPTTIKINHTSDLYYRVTPINGYIVIQNNSTNGALLALTMIRATNLLKPVLNGGIVSISSSEAIEMVSEFTAYMNYKQNEEQENNQPAEPAIKAPSLEEQTKENELFAEVLFDSVRKWIGEE